MKFYMALPIVNIIIIFYKNNQYKEPFKILVLEEKGKQRVILEPLILKDKEIELKIKESFAKL